MNSAAPKFPSEHGVIVARTRGSYTVRLDEGREIQAILTKRAVREHCILMNLTGWSVFVRLREPPLPNLIVKLRMPDLT